MLVFFFKRNNILRAISKCISVFKIALALTSSSFDHTRIVYIPTGCKKVITSAYGHVSEMAGPMQYMRSLCIWT